MQKATPLGHWVEKVSQIAFVDNAISNLPKVLKVKFLEGDGPSCFISTCKFGSFKKPFPTITSLW